MARQIHRKFIAAVALAAVIITALGTNQVLAQTRDTERALAALLGLAVIGAIIADKHDDDGKDQVVTRDRQHQGYHRDDRFGRDDRSRRDDRLGRHDGHHGIKPRPLPHRAQRNLLPAECLREVRTEYGRSMRVFGGRCLHHNYRFTDSLPRQCAQRLDGWRGEGRLVWRAHCLHRNGYRVSRR